MPPMPPFVCLGLVAFFASRGDWEGAFLVAASFDSFRTSEILSLVIGDIVTSEDQLGVIKLAHTKVGQRHAAFEASTILDPLVTKLWKIVRSRIPAGSSSNLWIYYRNTAKFHKQFREGLEFLNVDEFGFRVYSLRRGGATAFYRATGNLPQTIERGRWGDVRTARIYINDGVAKIVDLAIPRAPSMPSTPTSSPF